MLGDMKLREKSSVFRRCLKISSDGAERAVDGKLLHTRAAATLKALSPTVERRVGGTTTVSVAAERRRRRESRAETRCSMFARYDGARPWKQR